MTQGRLKPAQIKIKKGHIPHHQSRAGCQEVSCRVVLPIWADLPKNPKLFAVVEEEEETLLDTDEAGPDADDVAAEALVEAGLDEAEPVEDDERTLSKTPLYGKDFSQDELDATRLYLGEIGFFRRC